MKVLVINAGSSSLKYQLMDMDNETVLAKGNCERIGIGDGIITHKTAEGKVVTETKDLPTHSEAFRSLVNLLLEGEGKVISSISEIGAVGQRAVHGGEFFSESVLVTDDVLAKIEELSDLAPLHNPAAVQAIKAAFEVFGKNVPQVAVFDTAFHQTLPAKAYMYALPYEYYEKYHVRRYGFHGTSHRYVSSRLYELSGISRENSKIIVCHLGNGSSLSAVKNGECIDTSMGFTPLEGFIMGTRAGSLDASIVSFLAEKEGISAKEVTGILNKKSGLLGISGVSSDNRDINAAADEGNMRAKLALDMLGYQIKRYVGSYAAVLGGLDAIAFTGGIGENDDKVRSQVCADMDFLGLKIDEAVNAKTRSKEVNLSAPGALVQAWVVPTNEELLIAKDTAAITGK